MSTNPQQRRTIGVSWCANFNRGLQSFLYPRLTHIYRGPNLFAGLMLDRNNASTNLARFDEKLIVADMDGSNDRIAENSDIFYIASHGEFRNGKDYFVCLNTADWSPTRSGIGGNGPTVAVFETCDLVECNEAAITAAWSHAGKNLRLILGFASKATVSVASTARGYAFADNLDRGLTIADAWLQAVHASDPSGADLGIAIALGDDRSDARKQLDNASLAQWPPARTSSGAAAIAWRVCH